MFIFSVWVHVPVRAQVLMWWGLPPDYRSFGDLLLTVLGLLPRKKLDFTFTTVIEWLQSVHIFEGLNYVLQCSLHLVCDIHERSNRILLCTGPVMTDLKRVNLDKERNVTHLEIWRSNCIWISIRIDSITIAENNGSIKKPEPTRWCMRKKWCDWNNSVDESCIH